MYKKYAAITLLMFGLGALPTYAADVGGKILLAENSDTATTSEKPKEKASEATADNAKKDEKKKSGDKKGGDEPNCE